MRKWLIPMIGGVVLATIAYPVLAHCGHCLASAKEYWKAMSSGNVTLTSAIQAAEATGKGKAIAAVPHEGDNGGVQVHVYLLDGDKLTLAAVDTKSGKVAKSTEAKELPMHREEHKEKGGKP